MDRRLERALVVRSLEALAPDPREWPRLLSTAAVSCTSGILQPSVNEVPPPQDGIDFALLCVRLVRRWNALEPGVL